MKVAIRFLEKQPPYCKGAIVWISKDAAEALVARGLVELVEPPAQPEVEAPAATAVETPEPEIAPAQPEVEAPEAPAATDGPPPPTGDVKPNEGEASS